MSNNIIDSIKLSGTVYTLSAQTSGGGNPTVELTQAEYDALISAGTVSADTYYIITDASPADMSQYWTSAQTQSAITQATSGKQETLVSGTNIKTINNQSLLGSGNIDIQGGGGSSYTAGTGIDITNNVISVTGMVDTTTYSTYTAATDTALSNKQTTLTAGTGISIIDNVISATSGGGGGGKAIEAGRGISITTGETADTVSFDLPIYSGTGEGSIIGGYSGNTASGKYSIAFGGRYENQFSYNFCKATNNGSVSFGGQATGEGAFTCGESTKASGRNSAAIGCYVGEASGVESFITGRNNNAKGFTTFVSGYENIGENDYEFIVGHLAKSNKESTTFGDSGNTLFSVGNGTSSSARHNAFEIRQNGDIYYYDGTNDVKLQDKFNSLDTTIGNINTILQSI